MPPCDSCVPCGLAAPQGSSVLTLDDAALLCMQQKLEESIPVQSKRHTLGPTCWSGQSLVQILPIPDDRNAKKDAHWLGQVEGAPPVATRGRALQGSRKVLLGLEQAHDLCAGGWMDPVEQQCICASCVSFAMVATIEATVRLWKDDPRYPSLSESEFFFGAGKRCSEGACVDDLLERAVTPGLVRRVDAPDYDGLQQPAPEVPAGVPRTRVGKWIYYTRHPDDVDLVKTWLKTRGPMFSANDFGVDFLLYTGGVYRPWQLPAITHAYCVVGYDEERRAWKCRNSFGRNWGEAGYFWIPWQDDKLGNQYDFFGIDHFDEIAPAP